MTERTTKFLRVVGAVLILVALALSVVVLLGGCASGGDGRHTDAAGSTWRCDMTRPAPCELVAPGPGVDPEIASHGLRWI